MKITSTAFKDNEYIPVPYTCNGPNKNPPLDIHTPPEGTKSFVLLIEDIDAKDTPWVHWLVFNIPASVRHIHKDSIPEDAVEGLANGGTHGYEGPCPIYFSGIHHYRFQVFALDTMLDVSPESDKLAVAEAMAGHILDKAVVTGLAKGTM